MTERARRDASIGGSTAVRRALGDAWWYAWVRGTQGGTALVASIVLSHVLDPDQFGSYVVAIAVGTLGGTLAFNWITSSAFRFHAQAETEGTRRVLLSASLWALLAASAIAGVLVAAAAGLTLALHGGLAARLILLTAALATADAALSLYKSMLMARRMVRRLSGLVAIESLLRWGGAVGAAVAVAPRTDALLYGQLAGMAVLAAALAVRSSPTIARALRQPPSWTLIRQMFAFGVPLAGSSLSAWVTSLSDRILLAGLAGSAAAGVYAAGYQIGSNIILLPSSVLMASAYPVLLQEYHSGGADAAARMLSALTSTAVLAGIAVVITVMSMAPLLVLVLGSAYRPSRGIIPLVAAAQLLMAVTEYYAKSFQLTNRTTRLFLVSAFVAVVSVAANVTLVPAMGMYGSATATLVAGAVALILTVRWGRPLLRFDLERVFALKVGAAAAVSVAAARLLPPVIDVVSLRALATLIPVLAFGTFLVAVREQTTIAMLRSCIGRPLR